MHFTTLNVFMLVCGHYKFKTLGPMSNTTVTGVQIA